MTIELLYTSAAQGLKQGSRGFCTVVCTAGLPINLAQRLESLSGYRHLYQPGDARADENPVCHSHIRLVVGGKTLSIVSRVAAYGVDYSQRTNKIAHHVVFDGSVPLCGPAAVLSQSTVMRATWDGECRTLASGPVVPPMGLQPAPCQHWQRMAGDAGWAGVVANAWLQPTGKPVWIIFSESQSQSLLMMMQEATALLPESRRWQATFSTYCTNLPPDVECRVRCVVAGSDEARMSIARGVVLDLTKPMGIAPDSEAADAARNGFAIGTKTTSTPAVTSVPDKYEEPDDDFETAFAEGTSGEEDYGLQPRLPSVAPILIKSPKNRGRLKTKRMVAEPPAGAFTHRTLLLAIAGVAVLLSLLGGVGIWFASSNPIDGIVEQPSKEISQIAGVDLNEHNVSITDDRVDGKEKPGQTIKQNAAPKPDELYLQLSSYMIEINENEEIRSDKNVATIKTNAKPRELKLSDSGFFKIASLENTINLVLVENVKGFDFESTPIVATSIIAGDKEVRFECRIANLPESPDLDVVVKRSDGSPIFSVLPGETLESSIEGTDPDGSKNPKIQWLGTVDDSDEWHIIDGAESKNYIVSHNYFSIRCKVQYDSSLPEPTVVNSKPPIRVKKIGSAILDLKEVFFATTDKPCFLKVSCSFDNLGPKKKNEVFQAEWSKNIRRPFAGNTVEFEVGLGIQPVLQSLQTPFLEIPTSYFKGHKLGEANAWLRDFCVKSVDVRRNKLSLVESLSSFRSKSILTPHLKRFVRDVQESPSNDFSNKIFSFTTWLEEAKDYYAYYENPPLPKENSKGESVSTPDTEKYDRLQKRFSKFSSAFDGTPFEAAKNELNDLQVPFEIRLLSKDWIGNPKGSLIANEWKKLHESVVALKKIIDEHERFEIELDSVEPVQVFKASKEELSSESKRILIDDGPIRVKLKVNPPKP